MRTLLVTLMLAGTAQAAPKATAKVKVSAETHKKYGELMQLGRGFQKHKDWPKAMAAFEKALEAVPDDVTALSELGWTAYLAKDLVKAEAATRRAVASDGAPHIRGAALYNLGLIAEAKHDPKEAIAAYTESLRVRPHSVVRAALARLDKAAAAGLDPFAAKALEAIKSPEAACKALPTSDEDGRVCSCTVRQLAKAIDAIDHECHDPGAGGAAFQDHRLAIYRNGGWFATDLVGEGHENMRCSFSVEITVESPAKHLVARVASEGLCGNGIDDHSWTQTTLVVLGAKHGVPEATPAIVIARAESELHESAPTEITVDIDLAPTWGADGSLTLAGRTKGLDKAEAANIVGRHDLGLD